MLTTIYYIIRRHRARLWTIWRCSTLHQVLTVRTRCLIRNKQFEHYIMKQFEDSIFRSFYQAQFLCGVFHEIANPEICNEGSSFSGMIPASGAGSGVPGRRAQHISILFNKFFPHRDSNPGLVGENHISVEIRHRVRTVSTWSSVEHRQIVRNRTRCLLIM